jgi:hypothetical protein
VKRRFSLLSIAFVLAGWALAGCATGSMVTAPDGYPAIYVRCHAYRMDRCYVKAQRLCPYGYGLVDQPGYGSLLIRCD